MAEISLLFLFGFCLEFGADLRVGIRAELFQTKTLQIKNFLVWSSFTRCIARKAAFLFGFVFRITQLYTMERGFEILLFYK